MNECACACARACACVCPGDEVVLDYLAGGVEGSLVHGERRRAALAERWGFKCRCVDIFALGLVSGFVLLT
jgi:hypothetical protein